MTRAKEFGKDTGCFGKDGCHELDWKDSLKAQIHERDIVPHDHYVIYANHLKTTGINNQAPIYLTFLNIWIMCFYYFRHMSPNYFLVYKFISKKCHFSNYMSMIWVFPKMYMLKHNPHCGGIRGWVPMGSN